jgi:hypothetical protein
MSIDPTDMIPVTSIIWTPFEVTSVKAVDTLCALTVT